MRTGDRRARQVGEPAVEVEAVQVHEVRGARPEHRAQPLGERGALVFVERIGVTAEDAPEVVPDPTERRLPVGNRRRLGDERGGATQRLPRRVACRAIGLVIHARERHQVDVVRGVQLPQDIERACGDAAVGRVRETVGEEEETGSRGHGAHRPHAGAPCRCGALRAASLRAVLARATANAASV